MDDAKVWAYCVPTGKHASGLQVPYYQALEIGLGQKPGRGPHRTWLRAGAPDALLAATSEFQLSDVRHDAVVRGGLAPTGKRRALTPPATATPVRDQYAKHSNYYLLHELAQMHAAARGLLFCPETPRPAEGGNPKYRAFVRCRQHDEFSLVGKRPMPNPQIEQKAKICSMERCRTEVSVWLLDYLSCFSGQLPEQHQQRQVQGLAPLQLVPVPAKPKVKAAAAAAVRGCAKWQSQLPGPSRRLPHTHFR